MGFISNLFKGEAAKSTAEKAQNNQTVEVLKRNFILCGNVYRNRDNSIPDLEQFLKLNLSVDDYVLYVHGESQNELQNRIAFKNNAKRISKKRTMEKRLQIKAEKSQTKSKRIDGLQNEFYEFGMFAPYGVYHAANTFGLHTLNRYNLATGTMMGGVFMSMGSIDPSTTMFGESIIDGMNEYAMNDLQDFSNSSNDLF